MKIQYVTAFIEILEWFLITLVMFTVSVPTVALVVIVSLLITINFISLGQSFTDGRTQGDVTRNLEVCSHHYPSYGFYLRNKDLANEPCRSDW